MKNLLLHCIALLALSSLHHLPIYLLIGHFILNFGSEEKEIDLQ